ncbi:MAG: translational machinery protein [Steroidobacteraceae bacterium]
MTEHFHAIVWVDHLEAKIFHLDATEFDKLVVHTHASGHHLHHKANTRGSGHLGVDKEFFARILNALTRTGVLLITGPGNARTELKHYIDEHNPQLAKRISAVEPLDHPSDGVLVALARKFFKADDRMRS